MPLRVRLPGFGVRLRPLEGARASKSLAMCLVTKGAADETGLDRLGGSGSAMGAGGVAAARATEGAGEPDEAGNGAGLGASGAEKPRHPDFGQGNRGFGSAVGAPVLAQNGTPVAVWARKRAMRSRVTSPGTPHPIGRASRLTIGMTSAAVPVRNASSAV